MAIDVGELNRLVDELRRIGKEPDRRLLDRVKALGPAAVPVLTTMATDEQLHHADGESAEVWAPLHAIQLLGELEAAEAVQPLLPLLSWDEDDWLDQSLPEAFGRIGLPALPSLRALLFDRAATIYTRRRAADGLAHIAQYHPESHEEVVAHLAARLDPAESQTPDDETLNAFVVATLLDLKAEEAVPAIRRAYAEDRVDRRVVAFADVLHELGLPPEAKPGTSRPEAGNGMRLWLRCTNCGYDREHAVGTVYCDLGTFERQRAGEKTPYREFVITRRITCPKCGAVDQYEFAPEATLAVTAELLKKMVTAETEGQFPDGDGPLRFLHFTLADGRETHPYEARDMYRRQVAAEPRRADLRLRYANVLRFLGHDEEAAQEYDAVLELEPAEVEALYNLALLAEAAGDEGEFRRRCERILEVAPRSRMPRDRLREYVDFAQETIRDLDRLGTGALGRRDRPPLLTTHPFRDGRHTQAAPPRLPAVARATPKIGRNDPCPCGSGKKYKRRHGR